jgi:hypothetical protein
MRAFIAMVAGNKEEIAWDECLGQAHRGTLYTSCLAI